MAKFFFGRLEGWGREGGVLENKERGFLGVENLDLSSMF